MNILKNPTTVKLLASQIISACDSYIALKMSEKQFRELITLRLPTWEEIVYVIF